MTTSEQAPMNARRVGYTSRPSPGASTVLIGTRQSFRGSMVWLWRAVSDLVAVPAVIVVAFVAVAVLSIMADQTQSGPLNGARSLVAQVIGRAGASSTLQAIATGLLTVTSITFSVLLLAVQQTAAALSPVVFQQFLRRRSNQALAGFFVGLALYAYLVLAAVQDKTAPVLGAAIALVLTALALLTLLYLVYTTIDQMRPANVIRQIYRRTLRARHREEAILTATRRASRCSVSVAVLCRAGRSGYMGDIDLPGLQRALRGRSDVEIEFDLTIGQPVAYGDLIAAIRGPRHDAVQLADALRQAVSIRGQRDLDHDATTGIDELGNIAWSSASSARQNPEVARQAVAVLHDIAAQWIADGAERDSAAEDVDEVSSPIPVVYRDDHMARLLDALQSVLAAAHEGHQAASAAAVLDVYRALLRDCGSTVRERILEDLRSADSLVADFPPSPLLQRARQHLALATGEQPHVEASRRSCTARADVSAG